MLFRLYVGCNNETKKLEDKKAVKITAKQFEGFTAFKGLGYWQGKPEESLILEIETEKRKNVIKLAKDLALGLKQDAIGLAEIGKLSFITV